VTSRHHRAGRHGDAIVSAKVDRQRALARLADPEVLVDQRDQCGAAAIVGGEDVNHG